MKRFYRLIAIAVLGFLFTLGTHQVIVNAAQPSENPRLDVTLVQQGKEYYEAGQFSLAAQVLEEAIATHQNQGEILPQTQAGILLSLTHQKLGNWQQAEAEINQSLALLGQLPQGRDRIYAQILNAQGKFYLGTGNPDQALENWKQAEKIYEQLGETQGVLGSKINQVQAMQILGFYRQATKTIGLEGTTSEQLEKQISTLEQQLQSLPDSPLKVQGLYQLGEMLRRTGDVNIAEAILQKSWESAQSLENAEVKSKILISLGNIKRNLAERATRFRFRSQGKNLIQEAIAYYQDAATESVSPILKVQAQVNQFTLLMERRKFQEAQELLLDINQQIPQLSPSRESIVAQVHLASSLMKISDQSWVEPQQIARQLATTVQQAVEIQDPRAESTARGILGQLYETQKQYPSAQKMTQKALSLAQKSRFLEGAYQWQWQQGRIAQKQGNSLEAKAAYNVALEILQALRSDLVALNPEIQFSFREKVEPVYREYVDLLLQNPDQQDLEKARQVIEDLQLAELNNFFRDACLTTFPQEIDQIDPNAAVIYPIILSDRLETIVSFPEQPLKHYTTAVTASDLQQTLIRLRRSLVIRTRRNFAQPSQQLYNWLIRPLEEDLAKTEVQTLSFVLDGLLRNVPMASLYDGEQYLLEKYNLALTPGLQLIEPRSLPLEESQILLGGLSEARQGFDPLPGVEVELTQIQSQLESNRFHAFFNQSFTQTNLEEQMETSPISVIHLATHGEFSSNPENTFILTWDDKINIKELEQVLKGRELNNTDPIELLVLSACETAAGDERAALGLAGLAVRSGVRSTLASLWQVSDQATTALMSQFYQYLAQPEITKVEALRLAQLDLLQQSQYQHPFFWTPFVLVGSWL